MAPPGYGGEILDTIEVVEKANKAPRFTKASRIDRPSRKSSTSTTSRLSQEYTRSRSRSREPYRAPRGEKRQLADDHYDHDRRDGRKFKAHYEPDYRFNDRKRVDYADIDSNDAVGYGDHRGSYDKHGRQDRERDRSRSPFRHGRLRGGDGAAVKYARRESPQRKQSDRREYKPALARGSHPGQKLEVPTKEQATGGQSTARKDRHFNANSSYVSTTLSTVTGQADHRTRHDDVANGKDAASIENEVVAEPLDEEAIIEARRKQREALRVQLKSKPSTPLLIQALHIGTDTGPSTPKLETPQVDMTTQSDVLSASPTMSPATPNLGSTPASPLVANELRGNAMSLATTEGVDETSAADYNPTQDMIDDRARMEARRVGKAQASTAILGSAEHRSISLFDAITNQNEPIGGDVTMTEEGEEEPKEEEKSKKRVDDNDGDDDDFNMFSDSPVEKQERTQAIKVTKAPQGKVLAAGLLDNWDDPKGYYKIIQGELLDNRYLVKEHLGQGMFAGVVRAIDNDSGKPVAIKIVRNNDALKKAGLQEINVLEKLNDTDPGDTRHIVRLHRHFLHKNHLCMVFESMDKNLRELLKKFGRTVGLELPVVRSYAIQMFKALSLLRKCNIIHADLKPDNVLADAAGNKIKIADLGSACDVREGEVNHYIVSRFYRAPEIMCDMRPDFAIDVWSIGLTLYELFTAEILFKGNTNNKMLKEIMDCRGKLSKKVIKRGSDVFKANNFDQHLDMFFLWDISPKTGNPTYRPVSISSSPVPGKDIKSRLHSAMRKKGFKSAVMPKELDQFRDLLEKCLKLDPEERITPVQALGHDFFKSVPPTLKTGK